MTDTTEHPNSKSPGSAPRARTIAVSKQHTVAPSLFRGGPDTVPVHVCTTCGAVVWDPAFHDRWHTELTSRIPTP